MQITDFHRPSASSSISWLSTATTYFAVMAALAVFIFFSVDETRTLVFGG